jgi:hypothetical protein
MILARAVYASMYVIGAVLLLYLAMIGALAVVQRRLVFHPDTHPPGPPPADIANAQLLQTRTPDGLVLHSWFLRPADATRPVVLFLQGNAGHLGDRVDRLRAFAGLGWGALLLGYRGYGGNEGAPSERGLLIDARTGLAALRAMDIASGRIVVWGEWRPMQQWAHWCWRHRSPAWPTWRCYRCPGCRFGCCCETGSRLSAS